VKRAVYLLSIFLFLSTLYAGDLVKVTCVIDGDTFEIDSDQKVRLIGVDTPETILPYNLVEYFGKEASAFTLLEIEGKTVRLVSPPPPIFTPHSGVAPPLSGSDPERRLESAGYLPLK